MSMRLNCLKKGYPGFVLESNYWSNLLPKRVVKPDDKSFHSYKILLLTY